MEMIIEQTTAMGEDALLNPGKYRGFLGVSITHKFFKKENMVHYFKWGSKVFEKFYILLIDDPDMYNFVVFKSLSETDALARAHKISSELKYGYNRKLRELNIQNVEVVRLVDYGDNSEYLNIKAAVRNFMRSSDEFRKDMENLMQIGIGGKIKEYFLLNPCSPEKQNEIKQYLINYIIDEISAIIYFTEKVAPIEVDPTVEFSTKKRLYEGDFPVLYNLLNLSQRGHIYCHPPGITKSTY
ncbi:tRNA-dependent cyclodipeptide synthase [Candidatus Dojkabacteria bacterium]|uniref:Cyclodipeptide synthase n=1 Tax=Candidatus Dojkabacteria bacterium TaxID=2099670 RepID=A0A3M0YYZ0_9BACT|nr:MAG: tRNA-dependent cyclodipeptide synthase [Candidatus Dojkabacteria bacterium]